MDVSKIKKIKSTAKDPVSPPLQHLPNIQKIHKNPIHINKIESFVDLEFLNINKIVNNKEVVAKHSSVTVFNEEIYAKINSIVERLKSLHRIAFTGNYADLAGLPDLKTLLAPLYKELEDLNSDYGKIQEVLNTLNKLIYNLNKVIDEVENTLQTDLNNLDAKLVNYYNLLNIEIHNLNKLIIDLLNTVLQLLELINSELEKIKEDNLKILANFEAKIQDLLPLIYAGL